MAKEEKITTLFIFKNADIAMEYYKRKNILGLKTQAECEVLIFKMAKEGKVERIQQTKRSPDQIVSDYKKHGMKILDLRHKQGRTQVVGKPGEMKGHEIDAVYKRTTLWVLILLVTVGVLMYIPFFLI